MNLDHAFAWVAGSICAYVLAVYTITEAAAWNRRRTARARAYRARRAKLQASIAAAQAHVDALRAINDAQWAHIVAPELTDTNIAKTLAAWSQS